MFRLIAPLILAVATLQAQAPQSEPTIKPQVLIQLEKKSYVVGENISFRASLENSGSTSFYISKHLGMAVDNLYMPVAGISDFYFILESKDRTWHSNDCNEGFGHITFFSLTDDEKKKAFLNREFLILEPGSFYGERIWLTLCGKELVPGDYTLTVLYSPDTAGALGDYKADHPLLRNTVKSEPFTFTVVSAKAEKGK